MGWTEYMERGLKRGEAGEGGEGVRRIDGGRVFLMVMANDSL